MDRRNFLSASLTASALSVAGAATARAQSPAGSPTAAVEYYDFRRYQLNKWAGREANRQLFRRRADPRSVPARDRARRGLLQSIFGPDTPAYYLLLPIDQTRNPGDGRSGTGKGPRF